MKRQAAKERLSALLDGELEAWEVEDVLQALTDADLYETAILYLRIGDVLREWNAFGHLQHDPAEAAPKRMKPEMYLSVDLEVDHAKNKKPLVIDF